MVDLSKEILFVDGISDIDTQEDMAQYANYLVLATEFGLKMESCEKQGDIQVMIWRGTKKDLIAFFSYWMTMCTTQGKEDLERVLQIIVRRDEAD